MMAGLLVSAILYYTMGSRVHTARNYTHNRLYCSALHCTDEVLTGKSCTMALDGTAPPVRLAIPARDCRGHRT